MVEPVAESAAPEMWLAASDFYGYLRPSRCGLRVWLRAQGEDEDPPGAFRESLMRMGLEHERRHLERFPSHVDIGELPREEQVAATIAEVEAGERVIYQGRMEADAVLAGRAVRIIGIPDFMLPARSGYAIRDSKLNRRVGPSQEYVRLQVETYGWLYEQTFGEAPVALQVHAGDGTIITLDYEGGGDVLARFEEIVRFRASEEEPDEHVGVSKCSGCGFRSRCWPLAEERQDVGLLPWVDRGLIDELHARGVHTLPQLLEGFDVERLAELERPWGDRTKPVGERAERVLVSARALVERRPILLAPPAIPEHATYVMFDLEGMPPSHDEMEKIYIWGMQPFGGGAGPSAPVSPASAVAATARAGKRSSARRARSSPSTATSPSSTGPPTSRSRCGSTWSATATATGSPSASSTTCSTCCRSPARRSRCRCRATG